MNLLQTVKQKATAALLGSGILALTVAGIASASMPDAQSIANTNSHNGTTVTIPGKAVQVAPGVFSLGEAVDPQSGKVVEGYMIVHYKNDAKSGPVISNSKTTACYGYLGRDTRWKNVEPWVMNPANTRGLSQSTVFTLMGSDMAKWEDAADGTVGNGFGVDILGNGSTTSATLVADSTAPDGQNEVYFGSIADPNAIAVTTVWGTFSGPTFSRQIVEWDMVFDDVKFDWSTTGAADKMDFENISTHELGHAVGMADLYNSSCSEETMYGYAATGETKKQTLNTGDIQGINALY